MLLRAKNVEKR